MIEITPFVNQFPVFFLGSLIAVIYKYILQDYNITQNYIKKYKTLDSIVSFLCVVMLIIGLRAPEWIRIEKLDMTPFYSIYWSIFLIFTLMGSPNYVSLFFQNSMFLQQCGKYSFGIYLFHRMAQYFLGQKFKFLNEMKVDFVITHIFLSFIIGYLFYQLVEKNLLKLASKINKKIFEFK